jgi:hypothetical protein
VEGFLREVARVLKTEGKFLLVDSVVQEDDFLDGEINRLELLRDPSHVRNYRPSEWLAMLRAAGFTVVFSKVASHAGGTRMELLGWMDRINTPLENRPALEEAFRHPDARVREALRIVDEAGVVSFELDELTLLAVRNT